jgi:hypothetical protein
MADHRSFIGAERALQNCSRLNDTGRVGSFGLSSIGAAFGRVAARNVLAARAFCAGSEIES